MPDLDAIFDAGLKAPAGFFVQLFFLYQCRPSRQASRAFRPGDQFAESQQNVLMTGEMCDTSLLHDFRESV